MSQALVVVEPHSRLEQLLDTASVFARGSGSKLLLFHATDEFETSKVRDRMEELTGTDKNYRTGIEGAEEFARDIGEALLEDDIDFAVEGAFGGKAKRIVAASEEFDCNHVFLTGRRRSPTGKAVFGDVSQQVILNVDVPVTLILD